MFSCGRGGNIIFNPVFTAAHKQNLTTTTAWQQGDFGDVTEGRYTKPNLSDVSLRNI